MITDLNSLVQFAFDCLNGLITAYFVNGILTIFFALYVVRKISRLLDHIR